MTDVDYEGLELIDMRLSIDVDKLIPYLQCNSAFPEAEAQVKQFNKGQSNPTYFIEDSEGKRWVLRKKPPGKLLRGAHQVWGMCTIDGKAFSTWQSCH